MSETPRFATSRHRIDPIHWLAQRGVTCDHITCDPTVEPQYHIIRQQVHDGTAMFTEDMIGKALTLLLKRESFYKPDPPLGRIAHYIVGKVRLAVAYGKVTLPVSTTHQYPGQRERLDIPVRVEYR